MMGGTTFAWVGTAVEEVSSSQMKLVSPNTECFR
jgi:hypothetical protein